MIANPPSKLEYPLAFLFFNGNAAFLDEQGQQICEFQGHGWSGLYLFVEKYPNAPVSVQFANPIPAELLPYFMRNIRTPYITGDRDDEDSSNDEMPMLPSE